MKIIIAEGLIWKNDCDDNDNIIGLPKADRIAQANDFMWVERLIKNYPEGTVLDIDEKTLKITHINGVKQ